MAFHMYAQVSRAAVIVAVATAVMSTPTISFAQTPAPPQLGALRTPPSPAFTVLGIEPSAVERPQTPADAAVTVLNNFRNGIPKNFAFEASPYWLRSQPNLTWRSDQTRTPVQSLARTASLSLATSETGTDADPVTSLAMGFRTLLFSGRLAASSARAMEALETVLTRDSAFVQTLMEAHGAGAIRSELTACLMGAADDSARKLCAETNNAKNRALIEAVLQSDEYKNSAPMKLAKDVVARREGLLVELAAAAAWDFAKADWETREFRNRAAWATVSYEGGPWTTLGVFRYTDDGGVDDADAIDWGGRIIYSTSKYAASLEFVERAPIDETLTFRTTHRVVGIAEYRLSSGTWVVASFGKDRQRSSNTENTLVAQLGLAINFSKDRYKF